MTIGQIVEPPFYDINLNSNFPDFIDIKYISETETITDFNISTTVLNDESWSITSSVIDITPFTFNFWFDLE